MSVPWEKQTEKKFAALINKVPGPMQSFAKDLVTQKAEEMATSTNGAEINEKIMVDAFFEVTPFGFHGPMKTDMESIGIDYTQYGHS